jgi:hypothetical protein
MEWLKRLTVDARRDERTIKSALSALSLSGEFLENGVIGKLTGPVPWLLGIYLKPDFAGRVVGSGLARR